MPHLPLAELAVLHRREEVPKPTQLLALKTRVELIPANERDHTRQRNIAHLVKCVVQILERGELRQVELDLLADQAGSDRRRHLDHHERLPRPRGAEHPERQRRLPRGGAVLGDQRPHRPHTLDLPTIDREQLPEPPQRNALERDLGAAQSHLDSHLAQIAAVTILEDRPVPLHPRPSPAVGGGPALRPGQEAGGILNLDTLKAPVSREQLIDHGRERERNVHPAVRLSRALLVQAPTRGHAAVDRPRQVGLLAGEGELAHQRCRQARGRADHHPRPFSLPHALDHLRVKQQRAARRSRPILAGRTGQHRSAGGAEGHHHLRAQRQAVDQRVVHQLPIQVLGGPLPRELAAHLHCAPAQIIDRHQHHKPLAAMLPQVLPQRSLRDRP